VNEGAAINKPSRVSLGKSTLLYVIWAREELFQGFWGRNESGVLRREEEE
jgi:hypothetical protein